MVVGARRRRYDSCEVVLVNSVIDQVVRVDYGGGRQVVCSSSVVGVWYAEVLEVGWWWRGDLGGVDEVVLNRLVDGEWCTLTSAAGVWW